MKSDSYAQPLSQLRPGQSARVVALKCENCELRTRLLALGITAGRALEVVRCAPFGDPIAVKLLGFTLSLRLAEAAAVIVTSAS